MRPTVGDVGGAALTGGRRLRGVEAREASEALAMRSALASGVPPRVSIVTVVYNGVETIEQTIVSVLGQDYPDLEYIVVDGGSTDGTVDILRRYEDRLTLWMSEKDGGIYDAMNKGLALGTGAIRGLINSDDWYEPRAIQRIVEEFRRSPDPAMTIVTGAVTRIDEYGRGQFVIRPNPRGLERRIEHTMPFNHPATFVASGVYQSLGAFDVRFRFCADYEFLYRAFHSGVVRFILVPDVLAHMRMGGVSDTLRWLVRRGVEQYEARKDYHNALVNGLLTARFLLSEGGRRILRPFVPRPLLRAYRRARHGMP